MIIVQEISALRSWLWAWVLSVSAGESCIALEHSACAGLVCFSRERAAVLLQPKHSRVPAFYSPNTTAYRLFTAQPQPRAVFLQPKRRPVPCVCSPTTAPCRVFAVFLQQNGVLFACFWRLFRVFCLPYFRQALKERTHRA